jgi:hypothetical protein
VAAAAAPPPSCRRHRHSRRAAAPPSCCRPRHQRAELAPQRFCHRRRAAAAKLPLFLLEKKMMVRPVVGCGGWHDVSIVSIFLWVVGVAKLQILAILSNDPCNLGCKLT